MTPRAREVRYSVCMARGWESKAVESQQEERARDKTPTRTAMTRDQRERAQKRASIAMSRSRVLQQMQVTCSAAHRASLQSALEFLDDELRELED